MYVMRSYGTLFSTDTEGMFLTDFDADANGGVGESKWSLDVTKAMRFETWRAGMDVWQTQSTVRPLRDDGKPNRPLTAFTVSIERLA